MSKLFWLTYLPAGEFGAEALWGVFTNKTAKASVTNWVAFYKTKEEALQAYPEAVQI